MSSFQDQSSGIFCKDLIVRNHIKHLRKKMTKLQELLTQAALSAFVSTLDSKWGNRDFLGAQWVRVCLPVQGTGFVSYPGKGPQAADHLSPCVAPPKPVP